MKPQIKQIQDILNLRSVVLYTEKTYQVLHDRIRDEYIQYLKEELLENSVEVYSIEFDSYYDNTKGTYLHSGGTYHIKCKEFDIPSTELDSKTTHKIKQIKACSYKYYNQFREAYAKELHELPNKVPVQNNVHTLIKSL